MNCTRWNEALIDCAAGTGEDAALQSHLAACPGCAAELEALRAMLAAVKQPVEELDWEWREGSARRNARFPSVMTSRITASDRPGAAPLRSARRKARIPSVMTSRIAVAAAALVLVGAFLHLRSPAAASTTASTDAPLFDPIEAWARNDDPLTDELLDEDDDAPPEDDGADDSLFLDEGTDG